MSPVPPPPNRPPGPAAPRPNAAKPGASKPASGPGAAASKVSSRPAAAATSPAKPAAAAAAGRKPASSVSKSSALPPTRPVARQAPTPTAAGPAKRTLASGSKSQAAPSQNRPAATKSPSPARSAPPSSSRATATVDWRTRFGRYWRLIRADRPIGWLLLLWPTYWGLWLAADGLPPWHLLLIFSAGVWLMRSAGCVINDYADRWLDPHVERTKQRPLATGEVGAGEALLLFVVLALAAFGLVLLTNTLTVQLSVVGVILAASYPYLKRHTWFPQVYLGMAFGWSVPMAFAAVQNDVPALAWMVFAANVLWSTGYDTWYAMVDREDDIRMGARSTAILFGEMDLIAQGAIYMAFFAGLLLIGNRAEMSWHYYAGVGIAALQVAWQFWIARTRQREACFRAFLSNHWTGLMVFAAIVVALSLKSAAATG